MQSIEDIENELNIALVENKMPLINAGSDYDKYVNMSIENVQKIAGSNANDISYILEQCAMNVQKRLNRLNAVLKKIKSNLNKAMAEVYDNYSNFLPYELILAKACKDHKYINELNEAKLKIEMEIDDIQFLPRHISAMSKSVSGMNWRYK